MRTTPAERELILLSRAKDGLKPGDEGYQDCWREYSRLKTVVQKERSAAGLLLWPDPPIPKPPKRPETMALIFRHFNAPDYDKLPLMELDARFTALCCLEAIVDLLRSPGFETLPPKEQLAALFERWPESQDPE